ncbi:hypothetical protein E6H36_02605 [Candidatus Bathyarchaeota archaeon]|nr:MAG: hypothetical protein AUJ07_00235 [Crenarchaeota archaeon 13_1_40CM_3_53_5]TMI27535.1 MAG: hypothetical protein E6H36_02605 [Candidatus Bathyarchaeota archaeon]TMI31010.1 MAG: hypothetical protein E6H29_06295 [Candidatus Bathyarchaeota archaeon]
MLEELASDSVAKRVVHTSLRVHEDDMVLIEAWQHTADLASDIALECYKVGAKPMITLMTDKLWWNTLQEIPERYLRKTPRHILNAVDSVSVWIGLGGPQDPSKWRDIAATRMQPLFEGDKPVLDKAFDRKVRTADVLLGQVTPQRARTYGFDYPQWLKMTEDAIRVDYHKLTELGRRVASRLERGSRVHLTSRSGTDLKFEIAKRPVHIQDGIIDQEDIQRGLVSTQIPSGKVEVPPIEDTAQGTVVFDTPRALKGRMIRDLRLSFVKGAIVEYHAKRYEEVFQEILESTQGDKDKIAQFAIGVNPRMELIGYSTDELVLGTASVGVGANRGIGGKNDSSFSFAGTITKPTIEIDGYTIMVDGKIIL